MFDRYACRVLADNRRVVKNSLTVGKRDVVRHDGLERGTDIESY
jgi:hypothetical protein